MNLYSGSWHLAMLKRSDLLRQAIYFTVEICNKAIVNACTNEVIVVSNCSNNCSLLLTETDNIIIYLNDKATVIDGTKYDNNWDYNYRNYAKKPRKRNKISMKNWKLIFPMWNDRGMRKKRSRKCSNITCR